MSCSWSASRPWGTSSVPSVRVIGGRVRMPVNPKVVAFAVLALVSMGGIGCGSRPSPPNGARASIIALDGSDWRNIIPLVREGKLPTFEALLRQGARGTMRTNPDFRWSPVLWTSIATGKMPEKHGVTNFMAAIPGLERKIPTPSTERKCRAIWNILSERDRSVGFIGWWVTWPSEPVKGYMVSDHFSVSRFDLEATFQDVPEDPGLAEKQTFPEDLAREIEPLKVSRADIGVTDLAHFVDLPRDFVYPTSYAKFEKVSEFAIAHSLDRTHFQAAKKLLTEKPTDLFGVFFQGVDIMQHYTWEFMDPEGTETQPSIGERAAWSQAVERYYAFADGLVGQLVELGGDDRAVLLCSDHGFRPGTERYAEKNISGEHRRQAVFLFAGPGIRRNVVVEEVDAVDVTPTLLNYFGLPAARDMDGTPVTEAFAAPPTGNAAIEPIETYEIGPWKRVELPELSVAEGLEERIRALGYLNE